MKKAGVERKDAHLPGLPVQLRGGFVYPQQAGDSVTCYGPGSVLAQQIPTELNDRGIAAAQRDFTSGIEFVTVDHRENAIAQSAQFADSRSIELDPLSAQPHRGVVPDQVDQPLSGTQPLSREHVEFVRRWGTLDSGDDIRQA